MRNALNQLIGSTEFKPLRIGGGGFVTGISMSDDGATKAVSMDVFNSYVKGEDDTEWRPLFTTDTLQTSEYDPKPNNKGAGLVDFPGGFGIEVARSDKTKLCAGWNGFFYFSSNTGHTMTRGNLAAKRMFTNSGYQRIWNDKIASHPSNSSTWLLGTTADGVYYTTDHGANIPACNGTIAAPSDYGGFKAPYLVDIGPDGTAYIMVQGTGVYSASSVSGTFTLMSGSPTAATAMVVDQNGTVWICDHSAIAGESIKKCIGGTWSLQSNQGNRVWHTIAINPANANRIALADKDGQLAYTADAFTNLREIQPTYPTDGTPLIGGDDIPWLSAARTFPSKFMWDGANANRVWQSHGTGIAYSDNPPTNHTPWPWYSETRGVEELVANNGLSVPGKTSVLLGCWDKPIWKREKANFDLFTTYPKATTGSTSGIDHAWQFDYAADDPSYIAVASGYTSDTSGYSEDDGGAWAEFFPSGFPTGQSGGNGGAIAVNRKLNQILVPGNKQRAIYTKDGWATWNYLPIDPNISGMGNWIDAMYVRRNLVTADKTREGVFAMIMNGSNQGAGVHGLHVTTNKGDNWTRNVAGRLDSTGDPTDYWSCTLAYIPEKSGELLYTSGRDYNSRLLHFTGDGLTTSRVDVGAPWGITKVSHFTFGAKADAAQSYPTIYFLGECDGVFGFHRTTDFFATKPTLLGRFPTGSIDSVNGLCADANKFGRLFIAWSGFGWAWSDYGKRFELV